MTQVFLSSPTFVTLTLERGRVLSLAPGEASKLTVAIPGESVAQPVVTTVSFGPYEKKREATLNLSLGTAVYEVLESAAGGSAALTADAIADTLETAPPADLARIQSSVSGRRADLLGDTFALTPSAAAVLTDDRCAITYRSNGAPVVALSDGYITSSAGTGSRAWYAEVLPGKPITRIGAEFRFTAGTGGKNGTVALIPWRASITESNNVPPTACHFTMTRWGWTLGRSPTLNGTITNYASGRYKDVLTAGQKYRAELIIDGDTIHLLLPDGTVKKIVSANIAAEMGVSASWEFYQFSGAVDDFPEIGRTWYGTGPQQHRLTNVTELYIPRQSTATSITSLASSSIPTAEALLDAGLRTYVNAGTTETRVLCRFTAWLVMVAGHSLILAPKFVDTNGATINQPYQFWHTAPTGGTNGWVTLEFVWSVPTSYPFYCDPYWFSTGAGDTVSIAGNKPITVSFIPLGV